MSTPNPLLRRAANLVPALNPFERFGLTQNPFPDKPSVIPESEDPRLSGAIYRADLRGPEETKFAQLMIPGQPRAMPMAFLMDYATRFGRGIGKTAFLNHQRHRIMADFGAAKSAGRHVLFAIHVSPAADGRCRKFWQFTRLLAETLNEQGIIARTVWRLRAFSGAIPDQVLAAVTDDPQQTLGNDAWLTQNNVDVHFDLNRKVQQSLTATGVSEGIAQPLAEFGALPEKFRRFLNSESEHAWRQRGGTWMFDDLVKTFHVAGFTHGLVLVDEFEKIVIHQSAKERRGFVDNIRYYFLDGPFDSARRSFFSVLWTIHPYVQELLVNHWNAAGLERFCALSSELAAENTIEFRPLAESAAQPLALEYLNCARMRPEDKDRLDPFDQGALVEALRLTKGVPGHMLRLLCRVMDHAVFENWPQIDLERIREVFQREPPLPLDDAPEEQRLPVARVNLRAEE